MTGRGRAVASQPTRRGTFSGSRSPAVLTSRARPSEPRQPTFSRSMTKTSVSLAAIPAPGDVEP